MVKLLLVVGLLLGSIQTFGEVLVNEKSTEIFGDRVFVQDSIESDKEKITISQPSSNIGVNETVRKFPGAYTTQTAGPGTTSTVISPSSTGSGGTTLTINDVPIPAPFGRGSDLTFFPPYFFEQYSWYSPFSPWSEGVVTPGGRLDVKTKTAKTESWHFGTGAIAGSASTYQLNADAGFRDSGGPYYFGFSALDTKGNFSYKDPYTGAQAVRENNAGKSYSGIFSKNVFDSVDKASLNILGMLQVSHKTEPGSIDTARSQAFGGGAGHDNLFGLISIRSEQKNAVAIDSTQSVLFSYMDNQNKYSNIAQASLTGPTTYRDGFENARSYFFAYQAKGDREKEHWFVQADWLHEGVEAYYPLDESRRTYGFTLGYDAFEVATNHGLIPRIRLESSSSHGFAYNGSLSYVMDIGQAHQFFLSYSELSRTPSLIAIFGYLEAGLPVTGNKDLPNEKIRMASMGHNFFSRNWSLWTTAWYSQHTDLGLRTTGSDGLGRFTKVSEAQIFGLINNLSIEIVKDLQLQLSAMLQKTKNIDTGKELTFKPNYILTGDLTYHFTNFLSSTVEDSYLGTRFFSASNSLSDGPINFVNFRLDLKVGDGAGFAKVANLLDAGGYDNPGYPIPGRSFWLGYNHNFD